MTRPARVPAASVPAKRRSTSSQVFEKLRDMVILYEIKPGERLNEVALAEKLGVSRTPVRDALHLLARDGFLEESGRGYIRRPLNLKEMLDVYEAREAIEVECLKLASQRATPEQIAEIEAFLAESRTVPENYPVLDLVSLDEKFHDMLAQLSGNNELRRILNELNGRIRFVRWINMEQIGRGKTQAEHAAILQALRDKDADAAEACMRSHISQRTAQIKESITEGLARIFLRD
ncbi:GntR family transcriptional regulator [Allopusillimonas soli]|uniref:GntR family transcriptional regulator n=1 Tax=Allopusillimonas soli TaxID=659016 RepID=A0A853FAF5_9BURK|nr:GntR family transcriptional regulator [Allopusillimonas soli]NYT37694.1 GntR family transcriptional regulator [Allopusillimonas soli]TEA74354.1 GntR family transcriptional regulator [Allopusillimonas soli]